MIEKIEVSVTLSENFEGIMILMNTSFSETIKKDKYFFEKLGKKLDANFKEGYYND